MILRIGVAKGTQPPTAIWHSNRSIEQPWGPPLLGKEMFRSALNSHRGKWLRSSSDPASTCPTPRPAKNDKKVSAAADRDHCKK
jgi:hypothetical protein